MSIANPNLFAPRMAADIAGMAVDAAEGCNWILASSLFREAANRSIDPGDEDTFRDLAERCTEYAKATREVVRR